jgi:hypothetical protein
MTEGNKIERLITQGKTVFYKTITGKVYKYLKKYEEVDTEKLINYLMKKYLVKALGKTYHFENVSACRKALLGITTLGIFDVTKDLWKLIPDKAKEYKQRKIRKYYNKSLRTNFKIPFNPKEPKLFKKIRFLQKNINELKTKKETAGFFSDPFKNLEGGEDIREAVDKIGRNQLLGMIEGYLITTKYCDF